MAANEPSRPIYPSSSSPISTPFVWIDWVCQWIAYLASNLAIFKVLEYAGKLTVVIALISWFADYPERKQTAIRSAWSVVNAKGGGRKESLEYLSKQGVDLKGLYGGGGYFAGIVLTDRDDLAWSDLEGANFEGAKLNSVKLEGSNLSGVRFKNANLANAHLGFSRIYPKAANFDDADISGADFRNVTLGTDGYRALAKAKNWKKAIFDDRTRKLVECAEQGSAAPSECQLSVPEILSGGDSADQALFVSSVLRNIRCELTDAVNKVRQASKTTFLDSWGVQMTLTLATGAQGAAGDATRANRINSYYSVSDLLKLGNCATASRSNKSVLLQSDLKLADWLFTALVAVSVGETSSASPPAVHENVLQHEIKFVVVADGATDQQFKLTRISNDPGKTRSSLSAEGPRTYNLLVTFGPISSRRTVGELTGAAADLHRSTLTVLGIETAIKSSSQ